MDARCDIHRHYAQEDLEQGMAGRAATAEISHHEDQRPDAEDADTYLVSGDLSRAAMK
jgi:hypothetical protein